MPEAYDNPFSGLQRGLQSGFTMGLQMRAQGLAEQKLKADQDAKVAQDKAEKEKKNFEQGIQLLDTGAKYRKFGPAYQEKALELIKKGGTLLGMEMPENMPTYQQEFDEVGSDIELAIKGFKQFGDRDVLEKGLRGAYTKAGSILEANDLKALKEDTGAQVKDMVGRQEASMLAQASRIPDLAKQTDSEGNPLLSPEQAKEGTINASQGGGQAGQDLIKGMLEAGKTKDVNEFQTFKSSYLEDNPNASGIDVLRAYKELSTGVDKPATQAQKATIGHSLRQELRANPYVKDFQTMDSKFTAMEKALDRSKTTNNFVAVDQALITLFNKILDPSSVVRESEYARTPENLSLISRFKGKIEKYGAGGAGITQVDRQAIVDMALDIKSAYTDSYDATIEDYKALAKEVGVSEKLIGIPFGRHKIKDKPSAPENGGWGIKRID